MLWRERFQINASSPNPKVCDPIHLVTIGQVCMNEGRWHIQGLQEVVLVAEEASKNVRGVR